ncbi:MAG: DUF58 domain-containing protein [Candidatus Altiarchaeota archaeon]
MTIDPSFLDELKELKFILKRRVQSLYAGGRPSIQHGRGLEIIDYPEYSPGDDFRLVDWRLYARTEKLYIKRFEEERDLETHVLLDASASMDFRTTSISKYDFAGSIALGFAYIASVNNEKFALGLYSKELRDVIQPLRGKTNIFRVIDLLNKTKLRGETDLGVSATQYSKMLKSKSFAVVVSDFLEPIESLREGFYRLAKHVKDLIIVQVLDPGEISFRWSEDVKFKDLETSRMKPTYLSPTFKAEYERRFNEHINSLQEIAHDLGCDFISLKTDSSITEAFVDLLGGAKRHA